MLAVVAADLRSQDGARREQTHREVNAEREEGVVALVGRAGRGVGGLVDDLLDALVRRARVRLVLVAEVLDAAADVAVVVVLVGALARGLAIVVIAAADLRIQHGTETTARTFSWTQRLSRLSQRWSGGQEPMATQIDTAAS